MSNDITSSQPDNQVDVARKADWSGVTTKLAQDIEDYRDNPNGENRPDIEGIDVDGWLQWVVSLYRKPVDQKDQEARREAYRQKENSKAIYRFIISQEGLYTKLKSKLEVIAEVMSRSADTFGFIGAVLEKGVIDRLSPPTQKAVFSSALDHLRDVGDVQIGYLYGSAVDGFPSQQGLWDFDQFRLFVAQISEEEKTALVDSIFGRIEDTRSLEYRTDTRYAKDFMPSNTLNRFLARIVLEDMKGDMKGDQKLDLLPLIIDGASEKGISLYRFWDHLLYELKGNYPAGLAEAYKSYLNQVLTVSEKLGENELFMIFKTAIVGNVFSAVDKATLLTSLFDKYDQGRVIEELFGSDKRYLKFKADNPS